MWHQIPLIPRSAIGMDGASSTTSSADSEPHPKKRQIHGDFRDFRCKNTSIARSFCKLKRVSVSKGTRIVFVLAVLLVCCSTSTEGNSREKSGSSENLVKKFPSRLPQAAGTRAQRFSQYSGAGVARRFITEFDLDKRKGLPNNKNFPNRKHEDEVFNSHKPSSDRLRGFQLHRSTCADEPGIRRGKDFVIDARLYSRRKRSATDVDVEFIRNFIRERDVSEAGIGAWPTIAVNAETRSLSRTRPGLRKFLENLAKADEVEQNGVNEDNDIPAYQENTAREADIDQRSFKRSPTKRPTANQVTLPSRKQRLDVFKELRLSTNSVPDVEVRFKQARMSGQTGTEEKKPSVPDDLLKLLPVGARYPTVRVGSLDGELINPDQQPQLRSSQSEIIDSGNTTTTTTATTTGAVQTSTASVETTIEVGSISTTTTALPKESQTTSLSNGSTEKSNSVDGTDSTEKSTTFITEPGTEVSTTEHPEGILILKPLVSFEVPPRSKVAQESADSATDQLLSVVSDTTSSATSEESVPSTEASVDKATFKATESTTTAAATTAGQKHLATDATTQQDSLDWNLITDNEGWEKITSTQAAPVDEKQVQEEAVLYADTVNLTAAIVFLCIGVVLVAIALFILCLIAKKGDQEDNIRPCSARRFSVA